MAGNPKYHADLTRLAVEPELGSTVLRMMAEGLTMSRICVATHLSKAAIREWLEARPERADAASRARARAADELVDETLDIADTCAPGDEQRAKLRVTTRQWAAERWNPGRYAQQRGLAVTVNVQALHLQALQRRASPVTVDMVEPLSIEDQLAQL